MRAPALFSALVAAAAGFASSALLVSQPGAYFADYAHYRPPPYSIGAADLAPIIDRLSTVELFTYYFCPPAGTNPMPYWAVPPYGSCTDATAFTLMSVEPMDEPYLAALAAFRAARPAGALKILIAVGGWNFPSAYFSSLAASPSARAAFVASASALLAATGADGLSLDWESPCSVPREATVEISCTEFRDVSDAGGNCPSDTVNIALLVNELRAGLHAGAVISLATQASRQLELDMNVSALAEVADWLDVMTYDYSVSDIANPGGLAPNAPLFNPADSAVLQMSINYTVQNYLAAGVPPAKIRVGIPLYGHAWFAPTLGAAWASFGAPSAMQGQCCGPFQATGGAQPGVGAQQCGTMMYSELLAAAPSLTHYDNATQSDIAYFAAPGADGGHTAAGTWVSYNGVDSVTAITRWAASLGLNGVFVFDATMDSKDFTLINAVADAAAQ